MAYDFHNLTQSQQWLLTVGGWDVSTRTISKPSRAVVQPLIDRGLVTEHRAAFRGVCVDAFIVPTGVHRAWLDFCAESNPVNQPKQRAHQRGVA